VLAFLADGSLIATVVSALPARVLCTTAELSRGFGECASPADHAGGEVEQGAVVLGLLAPADQDRAVAVEPGVGGLDDPASGTVAGVAALVFAFVATRADVRPEAERLDLLAHGRRVVALV
jgi:hypothetical protein